MQPTKITGGHGEIKTVDVWEIPDDTAEVSASQKPAEPDRPPPADKKAS